MYNSQGRDWWKGDENIDALSLVFPLLNSYSISEQTDCLVHVTPPGQCVSHPSAIILSLLHLLHVYKLPSFPSRHLKSFGRGKNKNIELPQIIILPPRKSLIARECYPPSGADWRNSPVHFNVIRSAQLQLLDKKLKRTTDMSVLMLFMVSLYWF